MVAPVVPVIFRVAGIELGKELTGAFGELVERALDAALAVDQLAKQTGFGVEHLQELRFAAGQNGLTFDQLGQALTQLQTKVGLLSLAARDHPIKFKDTSSLEAAFRALGLDIGTIGQATQEEIFRQIVNGLSRIENLAERQAIAVELFDAQIGPGIGQLADGGLERLDELGSRARMQGIVQQDEILQTMAELARLGPAIQQLQETKFVGGPIGTAQALIDVVDDSLGALRSEFERIINRAVEESENLLALLDPNRETIVEELQQEVEGLRRQLEQLRRDTEPPDSDQAFGGKSFPAVRLREALIERLLERIDRLVNKLGGGNVILFSPSETLTPGSELESGISNPLLQRFQFAGGNPVDIGLSADVVPFPNLEQPKQDLIDFAAVAEHAFEHYAKAATAAGAQVEGVIGGALTNMEDALVRFVETGKLDFRSLVDSMIADLIRLTIRASVLGPLANALAGAFAPGTPGSGGSGQGAGGGKGSPGVGGGFTATAVAANAAAPDAPNINVVIENNGNDRVETRGGTNRLGEPELRVIIGRLAAQDLREGGPLAQAIARNGQIIQR